MHKPTVHILLATYNGAQFLTEQLDSIARQTHSAWTLTITMSGQTTNRSALLNGMHNTSHMLCACIAVGHSLLTNNSNPSD